MARRLIKNPLLLKRRTGVISFTFDDAPVSACQTGSALLEQHACRGTWYIAGGLTGKTEQGLACHRADDLRQLSGDGHEIACHTFSHQPLQGRSRRDICAEFQSNGDFIEQVTGTRPVNFSFPLGSYGLLAKDCARQVFTSSRLTRPGIHVGVADLNALLAQRLYGPEISVDRVRMLIRATHQASGWLIFYTHDVGAMPSRWGCQPDLLDAAIGEAQKQGCHVLPIADAISYWQGND